MFNSVFFLQIKHNLTTELEKLIHICLQFGTMWWKITNLFGHRARDEARKLKFGDIKLCKDLSGRKYLEWDKECGSKRRSALSIFLGTE